MERKVFTSRVQLSFIVLFNICTACTYYEELVGDVLYKRIISMTKSLHSKQFSLQNSMWDDTRM